MKKWVYLLTAFILLLLVLPISHADATVSSTKGDNALNQLTKRHGQFINIVPMHIVDDEVQTTIIQYRIKNDIIHTAYASNTTNHQSVAQNVTLHKQLWNDFVLSIPASKRQQVTNFTIFTDGHNNNQAYVQPNDSSWKTWTLAIDYKDALDQPNNFYATLVHEAAHLVSFNTPQWTKRNNCANYVSNGTCMKKNSHLNRFYQKFWQGPIHQDWLKYGNQANSLYMKYPSSFVDQYAAASPEEDFAESFMYFVFSERPTTVQTRAQQKIDFFYNYDGMVHLRNAILTKLNQHY